MWGDVLEEDLYDHSQPFYDHDKAERALRERKQKLQGRLEQDKKIRDAIDEGRRDQLDSKKLKRKVIYVFEGEENEHA